jgi:putative tricarboxylic transport membrane protein
MRFRIVLFSFFLSTFFFVPTLSADDFPSKPLRFVVYTNPGGLIDVSARKIAQVLEDGIVQTPVVVENKKGAGGLVAMQHVLRQPADGHTLFALTSSVISKTVDAKQQKRLAGLEMLARVVDDYECLIVREEGKYADLQSLNAAVQDPSVKTIWAGPAVGGTDHLFALKYWNQVGGKGVWIPYKSGSEALAALMGGHAEVYVGNPQDVIGRQGLKILAVASPERLERFPEVATFQELGMQKLTGESLWRGFAVRKGTPEGRKQELIKLLKKVNESTAWKSFVQDGGAVNVFEIGQAFQKIVDAQLKSDAELLQLARK